MNQFTADFDGPAYNRLRDHERLAGQLDRVYQCMKDGEWKSLNRIHSETGDPHASISAQLRHLRKQKFGSFIIERKYVDNGLHEYRLAGRQPDGDGQLNLL